MALVLSLSAKRRGSTDTFVVADGVTGRVVMVVSGQRMPGPVRLAIEAVSDLRILRAELLDRVPAIGDVVDVSKTTRPAT